MTGERCDGPHPPTPARRKTVTIVETAESPDVTSQRMVPESPGSICGDHDYTYGYSKCAFKL